MNEAPGVHRSVNDRIYSVTEVIEALARLDGQTVAIRGVLTVRRENHSIADTASSELHPRLWINFHHATLGTRESQLSRFDGLHVIAIGTLDGSRRGHFNAFAGSFTIKSLTHNETGGA